MKTIIKWILFFTGCAQDDRISYNLIDSNITKLARFPKSGSKYEDALKTDEIFKELVIKPTAYLGMV